MTVSRTAAASKNPPDEPHALEPCGRRPSDAELIAAVRRLQRVSMPSPSPSPSSPRPKAPQSPSGFEWLDARRADAQLMETIRNSQHHHRSFTAPSRAQGIIAPSRCDSRRGGLGPGDEPSVSGPEIENRETYRR